MRRCRGSLRQNNKKDIAVLLRPGQEKKQLRPGYSSCGIKQGPESKAREGRKREEEAPWPASLIITYQRLPQCTFCMAMLFIICLLLVQDAGTHGSKIQCGGTTRPDRQAARGNQSGGRGTHCSWQGRRPRLYICWQLADNWCSMYLDAARNSNWAPRSLEASPKSLACGARIMACPQREKVMAFL